MQCQYCQGELPMEATFCPTCSKQTANLSPNQDTVAALMPNQSIPPELMNPYAPLPPTVPPQLPSINHSSAGLYSAPLSMPPPTPNPFHSHSVLPPVFKQKRLYIVLLVIIALLVIIISGGGIGLYMAHQGQNQSPTNSVIATVRRTSTPTATFTVSSLGTSGAYTCISGNLVISGSTALQPLVKEVAADYTGRCTSATIIVQEGGSDVGRTQVEASQVGIGDSDTLAGAGQTDLVDHQVNVAIFGVIVNFQADVKNLTTAQIQGICNGTYTNWNQVGGANLPIVVVSRPSGSGTRATFEQYVLGKKEAVSGPSYLTSDDTGTVVNEVSQTPGAIGYAVTGQALAKSGVNIISIDGNEPSTTNVKSDVYKFWNIEHMFTKGVPTSIEQALLDYMDSAQGLVDQAALQFVPLTQMQPAAITAHNAVPQPS